MTSFNVKNHQIFILFNRLSKTRLEKLRLEGAETYRGFGLSYWTCTRHPITQSLSRLSEQEEEIALQMFQLILTYAGLGQNGMALFSYCKGTSFNTTLFSKYW